MDIIIYIISNPMRRKALTIIVLMLLRCCTAACVWAMLILYLVVAIALAIYLWIKYKESRDKLTLIAAIMATFGVACYICVLVSIRKRVPLVIQLFMVAMNACANMPGLICQPFIVSERVDYYTMFDHIIFFSLILCFRLSSSMPCSLPHLCIRQCWSRAPAYSLQTIRTTSRKTRP